MERPIEPTDLEREKSLGRIALWLEPEDLQYLSSHCCCTDETPKAQRDRCGRIRFRAHAALYKSGVKQSLEDSRDSVD